MHGQPGVGHKSEAIAIVGAYFATGRGQTLAKGGATHVRLYAHRSKGDPLMDAPSKDCKLTTL